MKKSVAILFLAFFVSSAVSMTYPDEEIPSFHHDTSYTSVSVSSNPEELHEVSLAFITNIVDFMAKFVRTFVNVVLRVKRFIIQFVVSSALQFKQWLVEYPDQVQASLSVLLQSLKYVDDWVRRNQGPVVAILQTAVNIGKIFLEQHGWSGWSSWPTVVPVVHHPHDHDHY